MHEMHLDNARIDLDGLPCPDVLSGLLNSHKGTSCGIDMQIQL
jgi:hypothetical protein